MNLKLLMNNFCVCFAAFAVGTLIFFGLKTTFHFIPTLVVSSFLAAWFMQFTK